MEISLWNTLCFDSDARSNEASCKNEWAKYESLSTLLSPHISYAGTYVSTKSAWTHIYEWWYVYRWSPMITVCILELPSLLISNNEAGVSKAITTESFYENNFPR